MRIEGKHTDHLTTATLLRLIQTTSSRNGPYEVKIDEPNVGFKIIAYLEHKSAQQKIILIQFYSWYLPTLHPTFRGIL